MKIGELANESGCSVQTIRYYEKRGLLEETLRTSSNYRFYTADHLQQLLFVKRCRALDLSLDEIQGLFTMRHQPEKECSSVSLLLEKHLDQVQQQIIELTHLRGQLEELRTQCSDIETISECGILKTLDRKPPAN